MHDIRRKDTPEHGNEYRENTFARVPCYFPSHRLKAVIFFIAVYFFFPAVSRSQEDTGFVQSTRQEIWPELDVYYRVNEKFRLFGYVSGTQLKKSSYTDGALSLNLDYFALPVWRHRSTKADSARGNLLWMRAGMLYSRSPSNDDNRVTEYTIITEANVRIYLPYKFIMIPKNRFDWRFLNGNFNPRYRAKLQLERSISTGYISFNVYGYAEYFVNLNSDAHNRIRLAFGNETKITKHINLDVYFVHQFDNGLTIPTVDAIGVSLKLFFHKGEKFFK